MDTSCLVALIITFIADVLEILRVRRFITFLVARPTSDNGSGDSSPSFFETWTKLDPDFLQSNFATRSRINGSRITSIMNALAIFALMVPIIQVSWILCRGGTKHLGLHVMVCVLAIAGGFTELIVSLMMIGARGAIEFLEERFELNDWALTSESDADGTGWRVLEMIDIVVIGMSTWMNAFEWICFFFIMTIFFFLVREENNSSTIYVGKSINFGTKWSILGLVIGILGLFEFIANIMRLQSWVTYSRISTLILLVNTLILLPIWLFVLGRQLPAIRTSFLKSYMITQEEREALRSDNNADVI